MNPSKELAGKCPECKYPQYSQHDSSRPSDVKPYIADGNIFECANCGFRAHADWWELWDYTCYFEASD